MSSNHTPVAIVGGGPCGLFVALQLARRDVPCVVFETKPGLSTHPKAMGVSRRTSELFKQLGLLEAIYEPNRHLDGPDVWLNIFARSFDGEEWGRIPITERTSPFSPGPSIHCPQPLVEQVLYAAIEEIAPGCVQFQQEVTATRQTDEGVEFSVGDLSWSADWLVASDGAGGQTRHALDIETDGPGDMGHFLNVFFRAPYGPLIKDRRSLMLTVLSDTHIEFFVTVDGEDLWLMHHFLQPGETPADFPTKKLSAIIREASGMPDVPVEILSISPWVMSPKVSREFQRGRILFVGDSAARMSPAGGLGMNTGLQSAHNLAWKLAEVVKGTATSALLDTYHQERHGAAMWTLQNTNRNAGEVFEIVDAAIRLDWPEVRHRIAASTRGGSRLGIDLGIEYPAGALIPDGTEPVPRADAVNDYVPNARPGSRAPHLLMADGRSTLDFFGDGFVLLAADQSPGDIPGCDVHVVPSSPDFANLHGLESGGCVLVRPDGYVAARWRKAPSAGEIENGLAGILR